MFERAVIWCSKFHLWVRRLTCGWSVNSRFESGRREPDGHFVFECERHGITWISDNYECPDCAVEEYERTGDHSVIERAGFRDCFSD